MTNYFDEKEPFNFQKGRTFRENRAQGILYGFHFAVAGFFAGLFALFDCISVEINRHF